MGESFLLSAILLLLLATKQLPISRINKYAPMSMHKYRTVSSKVASRLYNLMTSDLSLCKHSNLISRIELNVGRIPDAIHRDLTMFISRVISVQPEFGLRKGNVKYYNLSINALYFYICFECEYEIA